MANPIPESVRKIWDQWNIRGVILLSLSLQAILFLLAPLRKGTKNKLIILLIWSVYLLSDWAAIFALGLISNSQRYSPDISMSGGHSDLLAFWTPFLILHLGGPDNITAFALEDNELWFRHLVGLLIQAVAALYIFLLSLSNAKLAIATVLMFIAASIKYLERTRAFYLASFDGFQASTFKESPDNAEDGYNKLMEEHKSKLKAAKRENIEEPDDRSSLNELEVMHYAYYYFGIFKGIVINLILEVYQHEMSRDFFGGLRPKDALRVIEVELNLIYEVFYTKAQVVYSRAGFISRFVFLGLVVAALSIFHFELKKHGFDEFDVAITYALFLVAVAIDTISVLTLVSYDLTFGTLMNPDNASEFLSKMKFRIAAIFSWVLNLKKAGWYACDNHPNKPGHKVFSTPFLFGRWSGYVSGLNLLGYCLKECPPRPHKVRSCLHKVIHSLVDQVIWILGIAIKKVGALLENLFLFQCFAVLIIIAFSGFRFMIGKVIGFLGLGNLVDERIRYVSHEPLTKELWEFIFNELRERSHAAHDSEDAVKISSARGAWILKDKYYKGKLMPYLTQVTFEESVLMWHIATELLYQTDKQSTINHREFSKVLADYMLHLLIMNSTMIPTLVGVAKITFQDTYDEILDVIGFQHAFRCEIRDGFLAPKEGGNVYESLLTVHTERNVDTATTKAVKSKSVLVDAILLAKELKKLEEVAAHVAEVEMEDKWDLIKQMWGEEDEMVGGRELIKQLWSEGEQDEKWELISKVWVELLSYAASYSAPRSHIQQVSKGGELITFVWFLMAHFGLRQQFHNTLRKQKVDKIKEFLKDGYIS